MVATNAKAKPPVAISFPFFHKVPCTFLVKGALNLERQQLGNLRDMFIQI